MNHLVVALSTALILCLSACGYLYQENTILNKQLEIEIMSKTNLLNALNKQNEELEKMRIEKNDIQQKYKNIHIKYDEIKIGQTAIKENAQQLSNSNEISLSEAILIEEKRQINKALALFFSKG